MSWMEKLFKTYESCAGAQMGTSQPLLPLYHVVQQAHVEVILDAKGLLLDAKVVAKVPTLIPATEKSATGRTSGIAPHALCDQVRYCATDLEMMGVDNSAHTKAFLSQLQDWCNSPSRHPKAAAILSYLNRGTLGRDLVKAGVLIQSADARLATEKPPASAHQGVMAYLLPKAESSKRSGGIDQPGALIRWRVETAGEPQSATWTDQTLIDAWVAYSTSKQKIDGICMVTGQPAALARLHPKVQRHARDNAKLISSDDKDGFTYMGRFTAAEQACSIGVDVSLKAHSALQWLISAERGQSFRNGDQVVVTWAVNGTSVPDPLDNTFALLGIEEVEATLSQMYHGDAGQVIGQRFSKRMAGYLAALGNVDDVVVMGVDSATPGRMAITYYREMHGSELLARVERWHKTFSWYQNYSHAVKFIGAPSPRDIAEAAYGRRLDDNLKKATVERLLPCIIDGQPVPRDLVDCTIRRVCNRVGLEHWEWIKCLGIACALYRGTHETEHFKLTLDMERDTRDYLYGRLLAIAEHIENNALYLSGETGRATSAEKHMHRFSTRPHSTWLQITKDLDPYQRKLKNNREGFHRNMKRLVSEVTAQLGDRFTDDSRLSGEYLLGYHCQWLELNPPKEKRKPEEEKELTEPTEQTTNL
ncbi:MAG: type I-C CRISPR-associated protein Cas8c/Csd1 [Flavobacteriales bacterium]|nr:type I-C CRISPR-associated protein Cas8c/Csd1 [Flavobacteriales bacterium]